MKNKKILIIVVIIFIIAAGFLFLKNKGINNSKTIYGYDKNEVLNICVNIEEGSDCGTQPFDVYKKITVGKNIDELKNIVKTINKQTDEYYKKSSESKLEGSKCNNLSDKYLHNYRVVSDYYEYDGNDYITVAVIRYEQYLCENIINSLKPEIYIYSKKDSKIISQSEFRDQLHLTDGDVKRITNISVNNVYFFYDKDGLLMIAYPDIKTNIMKYMPVEY